MATEKKSNTLAQIGPVAAPLVGVVFAVVLIAAALLTSSISEDSEALTTAVAATTKTLANPAVGTVGDKIPLAEGVRYTFERKGTNNWSADAGNKKLLAVPVKWEVLMDAPEGGLFTKFDENADGVIDETEWTRGPIEKLPSGSQQVFKNWDRNPADGEITANEWLEPPEDEDEAFARLNKNLDSKLTAKDGEITTEQEFLWDSYPFEGEISLSEYKDRFKPKQERAFGPVVGVEARVDAATMQIVVTWSDPAINPKPEDISFMIERRAPQTVEKRLVAWRQEMVKFSRALSDWDAAFENWWKQESATQPPKTNKDLYPNAKKAKEKFEEHYAKPIEPPKPSEWEPVVGPVTGNEYRDSSFELDVTYTYAVKMATQRNPMRNQKVAPDPVLPGWYFYIERQEANGHPIIVRNRIEMTWAGASPPNGSVKLTTWHKVAGAAPEPPKWYRVEVSEPLEPGTVVGKIYDMAALKGKVELKDVAGTVLNAVDVLPKETEVDFTTGFEFVALGSKNSLILNSDGLGDFEIDKNTKAPAIPDTPPASQDTTEVRCLTIRNAGKDATFEITRWLKVGQSWLRVVVVSSVKADGDVGREVQLASLGEGVTVYDATGLKPLTVAELKAYGDAKVDLKAGKYEGIDGRSVKVGGQAFDLFGTLYKG